MKRSLLLVLIASSQIHADQSAFSSQFLNVLVPTDFASVASTREKQVQAQPNSEKVKKESEIKNSHQKNDHFFELLSFNENPQTKLYRKDLDGFNFKYISQQEYEDICDGFPPFDEKKLTKLEKDNTKRYEKLITKGYEAPWYLRYINEQIGHGAFADEDIEQWQMVGEYTGIVIEKFKSQDIDSSYSWTLLAPEFYRNETQIFYVNAKKAGNFTRFINHSSYPNVIPLFVYSSDAWHLIYIAVRPIKKDEQLLVDYGQGYWSLRTGGPIEMGL